MTMNVVAKHRRTNELLLVHRGRDGVLGAPTRPSGSGLAIAGLVALIVLVGLCDGASAAIDMTGKYEAYDSGFPCHYDFIQTGTDLQLAGTCTTTNSPMSASGTIDPDSGAFSVAGTITGRCNPFLLSGMTDGYEFQATWTCNTSSGPVTATKCGNTIVDPQEQCDDGDRLDGDCCSSSCRFEPAGASCADDRNACSDDVCDGGGACVHQSRTARCDDGDSCTVGDACANDACVPGTQQSARACASTQACERTVARALSACLAAVGARTRTCYLQGGAACPAGDRRIATALGRLASKIGASCADDATVQELGYGLAGTAQALIARVQESCTGEAATIAARTFGGPQGAILQAADAPTRRCLAKAASTAVSLIRRETRARAACIAETHGQSRPCDTADTNARIAAAEARGRDTIDAFCPDLAAAIGMDAATYVARAASQARCVTATSHGRTDPLALDCGPRGEVPVPNRGLWTQVVLDGSIYGSRCGDGSPYAFWLRLAPDATSRDVVVNLQGGGACFFAADCGAQSAGLFSAMDDNPVEVVGILSTDPAKNPFADRTMVFLPYCTQDLHLGGGTTEPFPGRTVHRFGALNVRAALRYVRDVLWQRLGASDPVGYRPDRLEVLFAGMSSGGSGVNGSYHYVLDDLRWIHTTAVPDSSLGLIDDAVLAAIGPTLQANWKTRPFQPPYCLDWSCAAVPVLQIATSARLVAVPEQQILNLSNQVDTEQATTSFRGTVDWTNALRATYCAMRGLPGVHYWLPAESTPLHVFLAKPEFSPAVTAGGETLKTFMAGAVADPGGVTDHVDEGTLVADYPGVSPIPCLP